MWGVWGVEDELATERQLSATDSKDNSVLMDTVCSVLASSGRLSFTTWIINEALLILAIYHILTWKGLTPFTMF